MAKVRREAHACTGRGFSKTDPAVFGDNSSGGLMSRIMSFATRPNAHGTTTLITSSTFATSTFNLVAHGLVTGQSVALTSPGGEAAGFTNSFTLSTSLAFPLSRSNFTEYFVIKLTNDTFQLAISHYNAMKTVPVPITFTANIVAVSVTPLGGGAGWYLHDDFSRMETVDFATTAVDTSAETITLTGNAFSHMHKVTFSSTGTLPAGLSVGTAYWLIYVSAGVYRVAVNSYSAELNSYINITSQGAGTHTISTAEHFIVITDTLNPVVNDYNTSPIGIAPKFIKIGYVNSEPGYIKMNGWMWWDKTTHYPIRFWGGYLLPTYDSAVFSYQIIGGDEFFFISALLGTAWKFCLIDTFTGLSSKLESITKVGVTQNSISPGSSVVLQLASGQAANFTVNKWYFLYDFRGNGFVNANLANYVKVTARNIGLDTVTIETNSLTLIPGAVLTPYAHRYYMGGEKAANYYHTSWYGFPNFAIPFISRTDHPTAFSQDIIGFGESQTGVSMVINSMVDVLSLGDPDDEGYYDCVKLLVMESTSGYNDATQVNRIYGKTNNMLNTSRGSMSQMGNYRTLLGIDYLYFYPAPTTYVYMIRYSESAS